jgi:hypothetical protein
VAKLTPAVTNRAQRESALARRAARQPVAGRSVHKKSAGDPGRSQAHPVRRDGIQIARRPLEAFFAEFLEELRLKDFAAILTFNHPYRFRDEIVDPARRIAYTPGAMQVIAEEYLSSGISTDLETARRDAEGALLTIESMFAQPILKVIEISKTSSEALDMLFAIPWQHSKPSSRTVFLTVRGLPEFLQF